ncbi:(d)CMP kinase [Wohlfahrtiimonas chitiniclastica]|uniref:(d)CMP kinase n=1 Tax=Wohlfahrtiimonas chitiniclastica TaxID=400946 RepID=UPI0007B69879|nr:(d)CMP kinase [Wohlfahrtiimonas chitiniclastica]KZX37910.1 cytidylate kinase [Wohlfahrtiimonas chitiniclastica]MBS7827823.1 (d)CMP kinase [Wohlfahrtiimonas chitiniclastica]
MTVPIITIDGPGGVGKGTLALTLSKKLGWHLLDSGAIYRAYAIFAMDHQIDLDDEAALVAMKDQFSMRANPTDKGVEIFVNDENVTERLRMETTGSSASIIAKHLKVRDALFHYQRDCAVMPGLIADGRDMGTVVFKEAPLKIFLTATAEVRADRRYKQLISVNESVNIAQILSEIKARDERDQNRSASPLVPAQDAVIIDTSDCTQDEVFDQVWQLAKDRQLVG